jgi:transposase
VVVAWVSWARHGAGHSRAFDDTVAWLAVRTAKSAVKELLRISWRTVGRIVTRVSADAQAKVDRFAGLRRIGIDEVSYKRGHRYLTVVVDHDSGRLVWAAVGRDEKTLRTFFDELGSPVVGAENSRRQGRFPDICGEVDPVGRRVAGRPSEASRAFQSAATVFCMTDGDNSSTR